MLDKSKIGLTLAPYQVELEKGQLRLFAKAIGEGDPVYTSERAAGEAGYRSLPMPPTFAFSLGLMSEDPFDFLTVLEIPLHKILHGDQQFTYHRAACAGETLTVTKKILDMYDKKGGALEFVVVEVAAANQDGEPVVTTRQTIVVRN